MVDAFTLFAFLGFVNIPIFYNVFNKIWWSIMQFLKYKMHWMQFLHWEYLLFVFPITMIYIPTTPKHHFQHNMSSILDTLI